MNILGINCGGTGGGEREFPLEKGKLIGHITLMRAAKETGFHFGPAEGIVNKSPSNRRMPKSKLMAILWLCYLQ